MNYEEQIKAMSNEEAEHALSLHGEAFWVYWEETRT